MYCISGAFGKQIWWLLRIFYKEASTVETDRVTDEQGWRIAEAEDSGGEEEPVKEKGANAKKGRGKGSARGKSTRKGKAAAAAKGKGKVSCLSCTAHTHLYSP